MNLNRLVSWLSHVLAAVAFLLLALGVVERFANWFGYTVVNQKYTPGRLVEFAAAFAIFVMALLLRQLREEMRKGSRAG